MYIPIHDGVVQQVDVPTDAGNIALDPSIRLQVATHDDHIPINLGVFLKGDIAPKDDQVAVQVVAGLQRIRASKDDLICESPTVELPGRAGILRAGPGGCGRCQRKQEHKQKGEIEMALFHSVTLRGLVSRRNVTIHNTPNSQRRPANKTTQVKGTRPAMG